MNEPLTAAQLPDRETFQRVWDRVMPQTGQSPPALPASSPALLSGVDSWRALLDESLRGASICRRLARRGGTPTRGLAALAESYRRTSRQLSAALFLATGQQYRPASPPPVRISSAAEVLRTLFLENRHWQQTCLRASEQPGELLLSELCLRLAQQAGQRSRIICGLLEQILPAP